MEQIKTFFTENVVGACTKILVAAVIIIVGMWAVKLLVKLLSKGKLFGKLDESAKGFILDAVKIVLRIIVILTAAAKLGVPMTSVVAVLGSAGVAIGLALQGGLSNIAGGVMILVNHPFRVGDFIEVGATSGTVHDISIYYTTLYTPDNKRVVVPNGTLTSTTVTNYSALKTRRADLKFTVDYSSDIDKVREIILGEAKRDSRIHTDPAPAVLLTEHADSALVFTARVWVDASEYWNVYFDLLENVKKAFDKENISIPFPQLDVHLDK